MWIQIGNKTMINLDLTWQITRYDHQYDNEEKTVYYLGFEGPAYHRDAQFGYDNPEDRDEAYDYILSKVMGEISDEV